MKDLSLFQCLGNGTRLAALKELAESGESCVGDLMSATGSEQSNLSHHLAQLRACGLVTTRQDGKRVRYRLAHPRLAELIALAEALAIHIECTDDAVCATECCT